jgi:hypothetical protein
MIILHTDTANYYLHDNGMIYDAPESTALYGTTDSTMFFDSLDTFLQWHTVTAITSEDGYKFTVTADSVTNGDMTFNNLESAIEELQR